MELLAPAGSFEKAHFAFLYGADAVYIGVPGLSLRTGGEQFTSEEFAQLKDLKKNKKIYCAVNGFFHTPEIRLLEESLPLLSALEADGFIVSDPGAARLLRKNLPQTPLHLSTQANCLNAEAVKEYRERGFTRIVTGRELPVDEIAAIKESVPEMEIEVFVHGAMCLAYSGRCFLSRWLCDRSGNAGKCAHSCRWSFRVLEEKERPGEYFPIEEDGRYTTILSSKDLMMISHLEKLHNAGVDSIKIEGRNKTVYYAAVVTRAYRNALDALEKKSPLPQFCLDEMEAISHRSYSTGFYFGKEEIEIPAPEGYNRGRLFLALVREKIGEGYRLDVKNSFSTDDTVEVISPDGKNITVNDFTLYKRDDNTLEPVQEAVHNRETYIIIIDGQIGEDWIIRSSETSNEKCKI